jgi:hypothetical protein
LLDDLLVFLLTEAGQSECMKNVGLELVERLCGANHNLGDFLVHRPHGHF